MFGFTQYRLYSARHLLKFGGRFGEENYLDRRFAHLDDFNCTRFIESTQTSGDYMEASAWLKECVTPTLNHVDHISGLGEHPTDQTGFFNGRWAFFDNNRWVHIAIVWQALDPVPFNAPTGPGNNTMMIYVDGRMLDESASARTMSTGNHWPWWDFDIPFGSTAPHNEYAYKPPVLELAPPIIDHLLGAGAPATVPNPDQPTHRWMDSTVDEFYLWQESAELYTELVNGVPTYVIRDNYIKQGLWGMGRYYKGNDGLFTSGAIYLNKISHPTRGLGGYSGEAYPDGVARPSGVDFSHLGESQPTILGVSWTSYDDKIYDWQQVGIMPGADPSRLFANTLIDLEVFEGGSWKKINQDLPLRKHWWTYLMKQLGDPYKMRYKIRFDIDGIDTLNSVLLESPIFDDFTIYYKGGKIEFLTWVLV
jgi:hypothetical protein